MSYQSWHIYGYGICVSKLQNVTVEKLRVLLSMAPEYRAKVENWLKESEISEPTVEDYYDFDQDYYLGLATILKEVIQEADHIEFTACDDYDGAEYLLFEPLYPWQIREEERFLTEEKIAKLLRKYIQMLSDSVLEIEYQSVENGG